MKIEKLYVVHTMDPKFEYMGLAIPAFGVEFFVESRTLNYFLKHDDSILGWEPAALCLNRKAAKAGHCDQKDCLFHFYLIRKVRRDWKIPAPSD